MGRRTLAAIGATVLVSLSVVVAPAAADEGGVNTCKSTHDGELLICARGGGEQGGGGGGFGGWVTGNGETIDIEAGGSKQNGGEMCSTALHDGCVGKP